jgi:outer membrane protein insertion porin family
MSSWKNSFLPGDSGRFVEKVLDRDIRELSSFYIDKGYPESSIVSSVDRSQESLEVRVKVAVKEGPFTAIAFRGNRAFYDFTLKKQVTMFREGNRNRSGERKSMRNILELYRNRGYPDAEVNLEEAPVEKSGKTGRMVTFSIREGPRTEIRSMGFRGCTVFGEEELLARMQSWKRAFPVMGMRLFVRSAVERDLKEIASLYRDRGYASAESGWRSSGATTGMASP